MKLIKNISWKKLYSTYGYNSGEVEGKTWRISEDVKDDLKKQFPKRILLKVDMNGVHLIKIKVLVKTLHRLYSMPVLLKKLVVDVITIHDKPLPDVWYGEIQNILKDSGYEFRVDIEDCSKFSEKEY